MDIKARFPVTKEYILNRITEEEIFERYLNLPVKTGELFRSPLRADKNPTCSFYYKRGRLRFTDWANPPSMDCFDVVMKVTGLSFQEALHHIYEKLQVSGDVNPEVVQHRKEVRELPNNKSRIDVTIQKFTDEDKSYLSQYGIGPEQVNKFKCFSIYKLWINGSPKQAYSEEDPILGYYLGDTSDGEQRWKIYFYKRGRDSPYPRFIGNTNRINGWVQMPKSGDYIVITKSMKDVMSLDALGVPSISMQNETTIPYDYIIGELRKRFDRIFTLYDFDYTGITTSNKLRHTYGLEPLFLTNGWFGTRDYGSKDISDYIRDRGLEATKSLVRFARERYE